MARNRSVKYDIEAKDKTQAGVSKALKNLRGFDDSMQKMSKSWTGLLKFGAIAGGLRLVAQGFNEINEKANEQAGLERSLASAVSRNPLMNGDSVKNLTNFAKEMEKIVGISDNDLLPALTKITSLGASEEIAKSIVGAGADMAAALNMDAGAAMDQLTKTLGGFAGELGELHPELKALSTEALQAGEGIQILEEKFRGAAEDALTPYDKATNELKNSWVTLMEALGRGIQSNGVFSGLITFVGQLVGKWTEAIVEMQKYHNAKRNLGSEDAMTAAEARLTVAQHNIGRFEDTQTGAVRELAQTGGFESIRDFIIFDLQSMEGLTEFNARMLADIGDPDKMIARYLEASSRIGFGDEFATLAEELQASTTSLNYLKKELEDSSDLGVYVGGSTGGSDIGVGSPGSVDSAGVALPRIEELIAAIDTSRPADNSEALANQDQYESTFGAFKEMFTGLGDAIEPLYAQVFQPLLGLAAPLGDLVAIMNPLKEIMTSMMAVIGPAISETLKPLLSALSFVGTALGKVLLPVVEALSPVIDSILKGFVALWNYGLRYVIFGLENLFIALGKLAKTIFYIVTFQWRKLGGVWKGGWAELGEKINVEDVTGTAAGSDTGSAGASYTAQGDTYIYMTNNIGHLVGDDGMDQFIEVISDRMDYLGTMNVISQSA